MQDNYGQYSLPELISNALSLLRTKLFWRRARLIRFPFYLRGRRHLSFGEGFTTGYCCRFDLSGKGITLQIGNNCRINDRVHVVAHESVIIGNDVLMASNIFISDTSHGGYEGDESDPHIAPAKRKLITNPVVIGDKVWIGEGAAILPGVNLGSGCIVGANAVVTKSFPCNAIVAGVPARMIKLWDRENNKWVRCN